MRRYLRLKGNTFKKRQILFKTPFKEYGTTTLLESWRSCFLDDPLSCDKWFSFTTNEFELRLKLNPN